MKALNETTNKGPIHRTNSVLNAKSNADSVTPIASSKRNTSLPFSLQTNMEKSFGMSFSNVNIHKNSSKAVQMKSLAFAQGEDVHFAPGQYNPDSKKGQGLIGHEFAHIAQQRSGIVKPTHMMKKGFGLNADTQLEREADHMGSKAIKGEVVGKYAGAQMNRASGKVIQRVETTFGGEWDTEEYKLISNGNSRSADIRLKFTPKENVDAEAIGLTQTLRNIKSGTPYYFDPVYPTRSIGNADAQTVNGQSDEGTYIDRIPSRNHPIYGAPTLTAGQTLEDTVADNNTTADVTSVGLETTHNSTYQLGHRYQKSGTWDTKDAKLADRPRLNSAQTNSSQEFETTALAIKGNQKGTYYGSVKWGWQTDALSNPSLIPLDTVSQGTPSSTFMKAADLWNNSQDSTGANTTDLPVQWTGTVHNTSSLGLRTGPSTGNTLIADIPGNATVTVMDDSSSWLQVQLNTSQPGVVLNATGRSQLMTGNLLSGYVSGSYIAKDAAYVR